MLTSKEKIERLEAVKNQLIKELLIDRRSRDSFMCNIYAYLFYMGSISLTSEELKYDIPEIFKYQPNGKSEAWFGQSDEDINKRIEIIDKTINDIKQNDTTTH